MTTILVVDDERSILELTRLYLSREGYHVEVAEDGAAALARARTAKPDLVVLDLMLPEMDGWDVCRRLRRESDVPIIMLTARGDDVDKIVGLEMGADDYMTKPFNPRELVARVKAVLRRYEVGPRPSRVIDAGDLHIDLDRREAQVGERQLTLRPKEFDLLATFAQEPGMVYEREKLLRLVWGYDFLGDSRTVDVHVAWLREKVGVSRAQIQTVWGVGYKLVVNESAGEG